MFRIFATSSLYNESSHSAHCCREQERKLDERKRLKMQVVGRKVQKAYLSKTNQLNKKIILNIFYYVQFFVAKNFGSV